MTKKAFHVASAFVVLFLLPKIGATQQLEMDSQLLADASGPAQGQQYSTDASLGEPVTGFSEGTSSEADVGFFSAVLGRGSLVRAMLAPFAALLFVLLAWVGRSRIRRSRLAWVVVLLALVLPPVSSHASGVMNYNGRLRTADGSPVQAGANYIFRFSIYNAETDGTMLWGPEQQAGISIRANGLFSVPLGKTDPVPASIFAAGAELWLEVEIGTSALDLDKLNRLPIYQSGRALYSDVAADAMMLGGHLASEYAMSANLGALLLTGGTLTGPLTINVPSATALTTTGKIAFGGLPPAGVGTTGLFTALPNGSGEVICITLLNGKKIYIRRHVLNLPGTSLSMAAVDAIDDTFLPAPLLLSTGGGGVGIGATSVPAGTSLATTGRVAFGGLPPAGVGDTGVFSALPNGSGEVICIVRPNGKKVYIRRKIVEVPSPTLAGPATESVATTEALDDTFAPAPLLLNPNGGMVGVGGSVFPTEALQVTGGIKELGSKNYSTKFLIGVTPGTPQDLFKVVASTEGTVLNARMLAIATNSLTGATTAGSYQLGGSYFTGAVGTPAWNLTLVTSQSPAVLRLIVNGATATISGTTETGFDNLSVFLELLTSKATVITELHP